MANGADGSITIDTELDNTGFKRGSQQTEHAVKGLINTVNRAGRDMASAVQSVNPALRDLARNSQQSGQQIANNLNAGSFGRAMTDMQKTVNSLSSQFEKMGNAERMGFKTDSQMTRFQISTEKAHETLSLLIGELNRFTNQPINTAEWERLQANMQRADAELAKLYARKDMMQDLGAKEGSAGMQRLTYQIEQAEQKYDELYNKIAEMIDRGSYAQLGGDTAQYQDMAQKIREMAAQLEYYEQIASNFNTVQNPAQESETALKGVDRELKQKPKDAGIASQALSAFGSVLARMGSYAASATAGLARLSWKGIKSGAATAANGVRSLVGHLKNLHKQGGKSALTANGLVKSLLSVKRMLLSRIKRTFISALFNSLKAGMSAFARYSSAFNAAMSSMKNSMTGLSGNLAVAAGNLVNTIAPAISTIIDWISQAITYLNAFFALLSGKSTYTVAKKGTDDYANSLKGAGGAAKELKNEVYGFDELNKAKDDSSGGGGGAGGSVDFEEKSLANLPDNIKAFMQSIKDAFAAGEWEKIGVIVAGGLNTVVITVDNWITGTLEPAGVKWASRIARILNGFNSAFDFYNLGSTISHGFNAILRIADTFLTEFDALQFGKRIGEGVNGIIDNLDWPLLGKTLADGFNLVVDTLAAAVTTVEWGKLGENFGRGVNAFIGNFHWDQLETFVVNGINGVVDALDKIVSDDKLWANLADKLATSVHNIIERINWSKMIFTVTLGLLRVVNVFFKTIATVNWSKLGTDFADGVNKIFGTGADGNTNINWSEITDNISESINGITDLFNSFITNVQWESLATQFAANVNSIIDGVDWAKMIATVALGLIKLANTFFIMISNIKWSDLGKKVADGLNKIFAKGEGSYVDWNELGKNFGEAVKSILTGIDTFITETDWFQIGETIADGLAHVDWLGIAQKLLNLLKDAVLAAALLGYSFFDRIAQWILGEVPEEIEIDVPVVFSDETNDRLKTQAGEAGRNAAWELYLQFNSGLSSFTHSADGTNGVCEFAEYNGVTGEKAMIAAAALIGLGFQNEMLQWLKDGDFTVEGAAAASELANHLFAEITVDGATVSNVKAAFSNAGIEITDGFAEAITGQGQANISAALLLLGAGVDQQTIAALDISHLHENLFSYMNETGTDLNTVANELATNTGEALGRLLPEGMSKGLEEGKETLQGTVDELEDIASTADNHDAITEQAETTGGDVTDELGSGMNDGQSTVETAAENTVEAIESPISELPEEVKPYAELLMAAITEQITNGNPIAVEAINAAAQEIVTTAANILTSEAGAEIINTFISGMESKIRTMESTLTSATQSAANKVVNTFKSILTISEGRMIGQNIAQGIASGITSSTSTIVAAATRAAQAALAAAKARLGINSPSKAFAEVGDFMMQGMAVGLKDGQGNVLKTVSGIAQNVIDSTQDNAKMGLPADGMLNSLDGITSKLSKLISVFNGIGSAISSMGGLSLPAVASGMFSPYKLRGDNGGGLNGTFGLSAEDKQRLAGMDEQQSETNNILRQLLRAFIEKDFTVDGRSMEEELTSLQRARIRSYGGT